LSNLVEDKNDFEAMMRRTGPRLYTLAVRLSGNPTDGQDLAQETYLQAFKHWSAFRGEADAATWLYRICVNCWKNRRRYEKRRAFWRHFSIDARPDGEEGPAREPAANDPPLERPIEEADRRDRLQRALARLEPQERAILVLREMEERSYEEIAELLGVPVGTVRSRLSRSRERLRERMLSELKE